MGLELGATTPKTVRSGATSARPTHPVSHPPKPTPVVVPKPDGMEAPSAAGLVALHGDHPRTHVSTLPRVISSRENQRAVPIEDVAKAMGWNESDWQYSLMQAADLHSEPSSDGKVSVAQVRAYVENPVNLGFLASATLAKMTQRLEASPGQAVPVESFQDEPWAAELARKVDADQSGVISRAELKAFYGQLWKEEVVDSQWLPDQQLDAMLSCIAQLTGEVDHMVPRGVDPDRTHESPREYSRVAFDPHRRIPRWVCYTLHAADIDQVGPSSQIPRLSGFSQNAALEAELVAQFGEKLDAQGKRLPYQATAAVFIKSLFDKGHHKFANSSVTGERKDAPAGSVTTGGGMAESFLYDNIAPQTPELNRQSLKMREGALLKLVQDVRGSAVVFTCSLFVDAEGRHLPESEISWLVHDAQGRQAVVKGPPGDEYQNAKAPPVAIPTHSVTSALLTQADGTVSMFTYKLPNTSDIPTTKEKILPWLKGCRGSVDDLEKYFDRKVNFFSQLEPKLQRKLEAEATPLLDPFESGIAQGIVEVQRQQGLETRARL